MLAVKNIILFMKRSYYDNCPAGIVNRYTIPFYSHTFYMDNILLNTW